MQRVYITGTFDLPHSAHFRLLQGAKEANDKCFVIVGLVTDELAIKQKRKPFMNYAQRRCILENCRYVDLVVPHNGESKFDAWRKLKYHISVSSDEYIDSEEFNEARNKLKKHDVEFLFLPKNTKDTSTSRIIEENIYKRVINEELIVLKVGVTGPLLKIGSNNILKPIQFSQTDLEHPTRDNYHLYRDYGTYCRNWPDSKEDVVVYPNIAGVNPRREILINENLKREKFSLFKRYVTKLVNNDNNNNNNTAAKKNTLMEQAEDIALERQYPVKMGYLVMKHGGKPLSEVDNPNLLSTHITQLRIHVNRLHELGISHNDLHLDNVLVNDNDDVFIIDFGWATCSNFDMCIEEEALHEDRLSSNFDWQMLTKSLLQKESKTQ